MQSRDRILPDPEVPFVRYLLGIFGRKPQGWIFIPEAIWENQEEEKLSTDTNTYIILIHILNTPSLIKEYRYNEFETSGRLSQNQVRDR